MTIRHTVSESIWSTDLTPVRLSILLAVLAATGAQSQQLPDGAGRAVVLEVCGGCHGPKRVLGQAHTAEEWGQIVGKMVELGAEGTDDEFNEAVNYLAVHFPKSAVGRININKASAKELETRLDLPAKDAEAIVRYRVENGNFKSLDELKKVPGLDYKGVEAKKDRLEL
jgi:competence protein ComEA